MAYAHGNASEDPQLWGNVDQILWGCATIGAQFLSAYFGPGSSITLARRHIPGLAVGEEQNVASFRVEEPPGDSVRVVVTGARIRDDNRVHIITSLTPRTRVLSFLDLGPGFELAARGACAIILHAALRAVGLPLCAHTRCALNPIETAGDLASASLLCCPVCYRRLELRGVPVHNTIQAVARRVETNHCRVDGARGLRFSVHTGRARLEALARLVGVGPRRAGALGIRRHE